MLKSGIYFIRNKINGKIYVGSAINLKRRKWEHFTRLERNEHHNEYLQRSWNKYGKENFEFLIIQYCEKDKLLEKESKS